MQGVIHLKICATLSLVNIKSLSNHVQCSSYIFSSQAQDLIVLDRVDRLPSNRYRVQRNTFFPIFGCATHVGGQSEFTLPSQN